MQTTSSLNLVEWVSRIREAGIPVLRPTALTLARLGEDEDRVDAHLLAQSVLTDPLMTLKVFANVAQLRSPRLVTDVETVTAAILMTGVSPFFRAFSSLDTVQDRLAGRRDALQGLLAVVRRARRAATFAAGFAVARGDTDAETIRECALLHDFAEMLLWCLDPDLMLEMRRRQRADPQLRSADVQRELLGVEIGDLEQALMKTWRLPDMLARMTDAHHLENLQVRTVHLAIQLARHTESGWSNPALPDDLSEIGELLKLNVVSVRKLAIHLDA
ncbi:MAG: HDOD domain-containing protein [Burkholderiaceae bacterium]